MNADQLKGTISSIHDELVMRYGPERGEAAMQVVKHISTFRLLVPIITLHIKLTPGMMEKEAMRQYKEQAIQAEQDLFAALVVLLLTREEAEGSEAHAKALALTDYLTRTINRLDGGANDLLNELLVQQTDGKVQP